MKKMRPLIHILLGLTLGSGAAGAQTPAVATDLRAPEAPISTATFTYQGRLNKSGAPFTGACNAAFKLFDAASGGAQIGGTASFPTLAVEKGLFTVELDFGWQAFNTQARWLETSIGCGEAQVTLSPRTAIQPAPYALALPGLRTVPATGSNVFSVIGGDASNVISQTAFAGVIAGGRFNRIEDQAPDFNDDSAIGGGNANQIRIGSGGSVIAGGESNVIEPLSANSAIGGGAENRASARYASIPGGRQAQARSYGQFALASGGFSSEIGSAQTGIYVLRAATAGAVTNTMYLDGAASEIIVPANSGMSFQFQMVGLNSDATAVGGTRGNGFAVCRLNAGVTTININWNHDADQVPNPSGWIQNPIALSPVAQVGACKLRFRAVGFSGHTIRWVATIRTTEVAW